jgi:hypothetical protein
LKRIVFAGHAETKFAILKDHGFTVSRATVESAVRNPDKIVVGYRGRTIAQKVIDETHVIRVVFEESADMTRIVTFYPGRRKRYEDEL